MHCFVDAPFMATCTVQSVKLKFQTTTKTRNTQRKKESTFPSKQRAAYKIFDICGVDRRRRKGASTASKKSVNQLLNCSSSSSRLVMRQCVTYFFGNSNEMCTFNKCCCCFCFFCTNNTIDVSVERNYLISLLLRNHEKCFIFKMLKNTMHMRRIHKGQGISLDIVALFYLLGLFV